MGTESGLTAFPCKNYCEYCGRHINSYFDVDTSDSKYFFNCLTDGCICYEGDKCYFRQSYGEGSEYNGFIVRDLIHFGENHHANLDAFNFSFGCVTYENKYFYK